MGRWLRIGIVWAILAAPTHAADNPDAKFHLRLGDEFAAKKEWDRALAAYQTALRLQPDLADALAKFAEVFLETKDRATADAYLQEALRTERANPAALLIRSTRALRANQPQEALRDLNLLLARHPNHLEGRAARAQLLLNQGRPADAAQDLTRILQIEPGNLDALRSRGQALFQLGQAEAAIADWTAALKLKPDHLETRIRRGQALFGMGRWEDSLIDFDQILTQRNDDVEITRQRGLARFNLERWELAATDFTRVLTLRAADGVARHRRADCFYYLGKYEQALADYEAFLRNQPRDAAALLSKGRTLDLLDRPEQAVAAFNRVIEQSPSDFQAHLYRANALCKMDRLSEALRDVSFAMQIGPADSVYALFARGRIHAAMERYGDAQTDYTRVTELAPGKAFGYIARAGVRRRLGLNKEALDDLNLAAQFEPNLVSCYTRRASWYLSQNRLAEAIADHEAIQRLPVEPGYEVTHAYSRLTLEFLRKQYDAGRKTAQALAQEHAKSSGWLYDLACALAIGAEVASNDQTLPDRVKIKHALIEQALDCLEASVAQGYCNGPHLRGDDDLNILRAEPRFQRLQARVRVRFAPKWFW